MKKIAVPSLLICLLIMLAGNSCNESKPQAPAAKEPPKHTFTKNGPLREISIWPEETNFPEHPGKTEFVSYCGICHSLKYITAQPAFPRATWEAEVHKMVEKYGAPIDSSVSSKVVDYLMAINGTEEH